MTDASERGLGMSLLTGTTDEDVKKSKKPIANHVKDGLLKVAVANIDVSVTSLKLRANERRWCITWKKLPNDVWGLPAAAWRSGHR